MTPGKIVSLFRMRRQYDMWLHGFKVKKKTERSDWD